MKKNIKNIWTRWCSTDLRNAAGNYKLPMQYAEYYRNGARATLYFLYPPRKRKYKNLNTQMQVFEKRLYDHRKTYASKNVNFLLVHDVDTEEIKAFMYDKIKSYWVYTTLDLDCGELDFHDDLTNLLNKAYLKLNADPKNFEELVLKGETI